MPRTCPRWRKAAPRDPALCPAAPGPDRCCRPSTPGSPTSPARTASDQASAAGLSRSKRRPVGCCADGGRRSCDSMVRMRERRGCQPHRVRVCHQSGWFGARPGRMAYVRPYYAVCTTAVVVYHEQRRESHAHASIRRVTPLCGRRLARLGLRRLGLRCRGESVESQSQANKGTDVKRARRLKGLKLHQPRDVALAQVGLPPYMGAYGSCAERELWVRLGGALPTFTQGANPAGVSASSG